MRLGRRWSAGGRCHGVGSGLSRVPAAYAAAGHLCSSSRGSVRCAYSAYRSVVSRPPLGKAHLSIRRPRVQHDSGHKLQLAARRRFLSLLPLFSRALIFPRLLLRLPLALPLVFFWLRLRLALRLVFFRLRLRLPLRLAFFRLRLRLLLVFFRLRLLLRRRRPFRLRDRPRLRERSRRLRPRSRSLSRSLPLSSRRGAAKREVVEPVPRLGGGAFPSLRIHTIILNDSLASSCASSASLSVVTSLPSIQRKVMPS